MPDPVDRALRPLVEQLRARYPRVRIVEARRTVWDDGFLQQIVRYRAPFEELKRCGLVTEEMLRERKALSATGETTLGDGFHLSECVGENAAEGCWELDVSTESVPRGRDPDMQQAREVLKRIFQRCKPAPDAK